MINEISIVWKETNEQKIEILCVLSICLIKYIFDKKL